MLPLRDTCFESTSYTRNAVSSSVIAPHSMPTFPNRHALVCGHGNPVAAGRRSGGGALEGRVGTHAAEAGPVGTPHVAGPLGRRTMMAAACGFPRFALDFSPRGRLALCRGGRRGPGGWYPIQ